MASRFNRQGGEEADRRFCEITGAAPTATRSVGDAQLEGHFVEVKQTSGSYRNLNQVRPYRYLPIVVYDADTNEWCVIPAHSVVVVVRNLAPMHGLSPLECVNLKLGKRFDDCRVISPTTNLKPRTLDAIRASDAFPHLKTWLKRFGEEAEARAITDREEMESLLSDAGLV